MACIQYAMYADDVTTCKELAAKIVAISVAESHLSQWVQVMLGALTPKKRWPGGDLARIGSVLLDDNYPS